MGDFCSILWIYLNWLNPSLLNWLLLYESFHVLNVCIITWVMRFTSIVISKHLDVRLLVVANAYLSSVCEFFKTNRPSASLSHACWILLMLYYFACEKCGHVVSLLYEYNGFFSFNTAFTFTMGCQWLFVCKFSVD